MASVNTPSVLSHPADRHLLSLSVFGYGPTPRCDACHETIVGIAYQCRACNFNLHPGCASLPMSLYLPIVHKHTLKLRIRSHFGISSCDVCSKFLGCRWSYRCAGCDFDAGIECVKNIHTARAGNFLRASTTFSAPAATRPGGRSLSSEMQDYVQDASENVTEQMLDAFF